MALRRDRQEPVEDPPLRPQGEEAARGEREKVAGGREGEEEGGRKEEKVERSRGGMAKRRRRKRRGGGGSERDDGRVIPTPMQACSVPDATAQRKENRVPPAASEEQPRARPGPEGDGRKCQERFPIQRWSNRSDVSVQVSGGGGIIKSIQLENFMCYGALGPVKFGSNVNFVAGSWGKSALLTALIVGLGGKSLGSSLRQFVKDGETSAIVSITIRNTGDCAFKSELYGDSITVQQRISVSGTASYKLKDQGKKLISSKKAELMAILEHFNIQVDNPAFILSQEMGRQLLQTRHGGERYKFFLKVTPLEQMNADYLSILEKKARTQSQIEQGEEQLQELKRQGIEIEKCFCSMVAARKRVEDLKHEMAWAVVTESEKQIEDMKKNINVGNQHTFILNQKLEACKVQFNEAAKKFKDIQDNLQYLTKEAVALETKCTQAKEEIIKKEKAYKEAEVLYNSFQHRYKELDKAKQHCNQIEELKKNMEIAKLNKQEKMFMLREKVKNFRDQEDSLIQMVIQLEKTIKKDNEEQARLRQEMSNMQQMLNNEQQQLNRLKECKTDPLKRFEPQIIALLEAVDNAHRQGQFTSKPVGPLGAYIHLRDPEFALAIESCLKGLLLAFCCDNHKDEQVLQGLMKRFYPPGSPRPQIIVSAFEQEAYDVTDRAAFHPEFPTVLTALEIDNAVVANALIDIRGIESVLLIKSNSLARTVMQAQKPPKNCTEVFTADGDQVLERRYYSCEKLRPTYLIDVDLEISHLEKEMANTMARLSVFQQHICTLKNDTRKNQETINNHHLHLKEIKVRVTQIITQIRDLENEEKESVDISIVEKGAQEIKLQMKQIEEKMKMQKEEMKNLRKQKVDAEQRQKNIKINICHISELIESVKKELLQVNLEVDAEKRYLLLSQGRLKQHLDSLQIKKKELTTKEKELEKEIAQAKYICPERKEVNKTASALEKEISLLKQKIKSENSRHRSREEIIRQYQEIKERYQILDVKVRNLKNCIKSLDQTSKQKYELCQQLKRSFALRCKSYFEDLISQCSYSGEMSFDHKNESLTVRVQPTQGNKAVFGDVQFQSESEISFSNFFFLLTLWSVTESPFRCLDAFDSYMDPISRRIAMDMILSIAHSQQCQQFILLTPQNTNSLPLSPLTKVFRLPDTGRGQPVSQVEEA
ncbi:structural maintenance of chromosomes protein 6-like [Sarcophilus harrisii]|uniref:Rad50/SbcC-type AAA domain-containing protein n=1 Tax=Sarcophilus harrisii TaxID=9305 RepID=A0A7N4PJV4_SARHA